MKISDIENWLEKRSIDFERAEDKDRERILQSWLEAFSFNVKMKTGSWIHERYRWHAFGYGFHDAAKGDAAVLKYADQ